MEHLIREDAEFSYGPPLTVKRVYKVKQFGVYQMNGVHQINNKSVETTQRIVIYATYTSSRYS